MFSAPGNETFKAPMVMPKTVAKLTLCRKHIFQEFGVKLNLDQPDILECIQAFSEQTENPILKRLAYELEKDFL